MEDILLISIFSGVFVGIVMGAITASMNQRKGYSAGGGFCWGFFLGIIGIIVVACRPFNMQNNGYGYPPNNGGYYPPNNGGYYPPNNGGYYPPNNGGYYPSNNGGYYPPNNGGYNYSQNNYPMDNNQSVQKTNQ